MARLGAVAVAVALAVALPLAGEAQGAFDPFDSSGGALTPTLLRDVSNVTVTHGSPSPGAGARTQYVVRFTTSSTGALSGADGDDVDVTFPAGTTFGGYSSGSILDDTGQAVGSCGVPSGQLIRCSLFSSGAISANEQARVVFNGVANPTTPGPYTLTVSTSAEPTPVTSAQYNVAAANPLTGLTVAHGSPSPAAGARTQYVVSFNASATGGLSGPANSRITVTFPAGTTFGGYSSGSILDDASQSVGSCGIPSGLVIQCSLFSSGATSANEALRVVFNGITNPTTPGNKTLTVSTTSDPATVTSPQYNVAAANPLTGLTVAHGSPSPAAGARTQYVVSFNASATGGLSGPANSRITVTFPAGTTFGGYSSGSILDDASQSVGSCGIPSGLVIQCSLFSSGATSANEALRVVFNGITNPTTPGNKTLTVSTTSDPATVTSPQYNVAAANPLTGLTVAHGSPSPAAGARTQYVVSFNASATGGLSGPANSRITVTFPAGTTFGGYSSGSILDDASQSVGSCGIPSGLVIQCSLFSSGATSANEALRVVFNGITNPTTPGNKTLTVSTTSDPATVTSPQYNVAAANQLTGVALTLDSVAASATTRWIPSFDVSATGGLAGAANSRVTVTFPAGTGFGSYSSGSILDDASQSVGSCSIPSGLVIQCSLFSNDTISAGEAVRVVFNGITNPSNAGPWTVDVSTTSDTQPVTSSPSEESDTDPPAAPTITDSDPDSPADDNQPEIKGSAEAGSTVKLYTNATCTGSPVATGTAEAFANPGLTVNVGDNTTTDFRATATDAAGNVSPCSSPFDYVEDSSGPATPSITDSDPDSPANNNEPEIKGNADAGTTVRIYTTAGCTGSPVVTGSAAAFTGAGLTVNVADNTTTSFRATATDAVGNVSPCSSAFQYVEDSTAPPDTTPPNATITAGPTGPTVGTAPTFEFSSNEAGSTFECSTDGGPFAACTSPFTAPTLPAGQHTFAVRARDAAGNMGPASTVTFTVAQQTLEDLPVPTLGEEVNVGPVGDGPVLIAVPAGPATARAGASQKGLTFVPLTEARQIPTGSFLDTSKGTVELVSATGAAARTQSGKFSAGLFQVLQSRKRSARGMTELRLKGSSFNRCNAGRRGRGSANAAQLSRRTIRRVRGNARGRFRTRGRHSAATVRGTIWVTADRCDGTLTTVKRGKVAVRDFRRKRTITVRAGKSYLAKAPQGR